MVALITPIRSPGSFAGRKFARSAFLAALWALILGAAAATFVTTRTRYLPGQYAAGVGAVAASGVVMYSTMLMVIFLRGYRPRRWMQHAIALALGAGVGVLLYPDLASGPLPALPASVVLSAGAYVVALPRVRHDAASSLSTMSRPLMNPADARQMLKAAERALRQRLSPEARRTAEVNAARARLALSAALGSSAELVAATDGLQAVLADGPVDPLLGLSAAEELVTAIRIKVDKFGDLAGFEEALRALTLAAARIPDGTDAPARVDRDTAEYRLVLAERATTKRQADAHTDAAITLLRRAVAVTVPRSRSLHPVLLARLGHSIALRNRWPGDLDHGISRCQEAQRLAGPLLSRRAPADLALARLLVRRAGLPGPTADQDLAHALALGRRIARHGPPSLRAEAWETMAEALTTRGKAASGRTDLTETCAAWRTAAHHSTHASVSAMLRVGRRWVDWAVQVADASSAAEAYHHVMSLIPRVVAARYLPSERDRLLRGVQSTVEEAGYWLTQAGRRRDAVVAIELGRAVSITDVLLRDRDDLADVAKLPGGVELLDRYSRAVTALREAERAGHGTSAATAAARQRARAEYEQVLGQIDRLAGTRFADAPATYPEIGAAAAAGPIVYLAAADRMGYALIVTGEADPDFCLLPGLTRPRAAMAVDRFLAGTDRQSVCRTLRWLWKNGISDLVGQLPAGAVVTVIPVGVLGLLPVHAAGGPAEPTQAPQNWSFVSDSVIVRYAPNARSFPRSSNALPRWTDRISGCWRPPRRPVTPDDPCPTRTPRPELLLDAGPRQGQGRHRSQTRRTRLYCRPYRHTRCGTSRVTARHTRIGSSTVHFSLTGVGSPCGNCSGYPTGRAGWHFCPPATATGPVATCRTSQWVCPVDSSRSG